MDQLGLVFSSFVPLFESENRVLKDEGYRLMGAAFEVYNQLGYGMAEEVYYLLNFGRKGDLEWKRVIVTDLHGTKEKESEH